MRLATVSVRAGIDQDDAPRILALAVPCPDEPWAKVVTYQGRQYVVGQGRSRDHYVIFDFPFPGHSDQWKIVLPINKPEDLLRQLTEGR